MSKGTLAGLSAFSLWALMPIYIRQLREMPALEILAHRIVWSLLFLGIILTISKQWGGIWLAWRTAKTRNTFLLTGVLLAVNWLIFMWAINSNHVVDASLGYFINPLFNVVLGVLLLRERLRPGQIVAVGLATIGVVFLIYSNSVQIWIGLSLAFSFGIYGYLRKTSPVNALQGLSLEMMVLFLPALAYLLWQQNAGNAAFGQLGLTANILLLFIGVGTAIPLMLFAYGAQRITLITLGILQFIAPTGQFMVGVWLYGEPLPLNRIIGFSIIWAALTIYTIEGATFVRRLKADMVFGD